MSEILHGYFARFNQWTEINSAQEGHFMERVAPGAFAGTMRENRATMRVLFQHGKDPNIGDKVLGAIADLREDASGAAYEVPLFDTAYNRELIPGLAAGQYGSSFRFRATRDHFVDRPGASDHNPKGLPERTILEAEVPEFGPVTFPAYSGATAGIRGRELLPAPEEPPHVPRRLDPAEQVRRKALRSRWVLEDLSRRLKQMEKEGASHA